MVDGEALSLRAARTRHADSRGELPPAALRLQKGDPAIPTIYLQEEAAV